MRNSVHKWPRLNDIRTIKKASEWGSKDQHVFMTRLARTQPRTTNRVGSRENLRKGIRREALNETCRNWRSALLQEATNLPTDIQILQ